MINHSHWFKDSNKCLLVNQASPVNLATLLPVNPDNNTVNQASNSLSLISSTWILTSNRCSNP